MGTEKKMGVKRKKEQLNGKVERKRNYKNKSTREDDTGWDIVRVEEYTIGE